MTKRDLEERVEYLERCQADQATHYDLLQKRVAELELAETPTGPAHCPHCHALYRGIKNIMIGKRKCHCGRFF